ncbi:MAG: hypothetical protein SFX72_11805 [Isosphaeraceae bacterium]|nr:hypothetical protein [Isosphaeraceae bacterium]
MSNVSEAVGPITAQGLATELRRVEPRAFLVAPRILRRVIRADGDLGGFSLSIPHRKGWNLTRARATELLSPDELGFASASDFPERVILLVRPEAAKLERLTHEQVYQRYWRLLHHARIHEAFDDARPADAVISRWIDSLGRQQFAEIRNVLNEEKFLLPEASDRAVMGEFAAVFFELYAFAPHAVSAYFPGIASISEVAEMLRSAVDDRPILESTRLGGVDLPEAIVLDRYEPDDDLTDAFEDAVEPLGAAAEQLSSFMELDAETAQDRGNTVRSAIVQMRAARRIESAGRDVAIEEARAAIDPLAERLAPALELDAETVVAWKQALRVLVERASRGVWPREARLLYTLQKICAEREHEVYTVDLFGAITSLGRRPLKRPLPHHREARLVHYLREASRMVLKVRLVDGDRGRLGRLIDDARHDAEVRLGERFRPILESTLDRTGIVPENAVERAVRRKLVEELLERLVENGFLRFGDLRDDLSANRLGLPDLGGPREFFAGDRLLATDKLLASELDGVYRRGEIYMRWLQRISSLFFGTPIGRFITCWIILPAGGAFVILEGLTHLVDLIVHLYHGVEPELLNPWTFAVVSLVILAAVNSGRYRAELWSAAKRIGRGVGHVLIDIPRAILRAPIFARLFASRLFRRVWNWLVKPGLLWLLFRALPPTGWFSERFLEELPVVGSTLEAHPWLSGLAGFAFLSGILNTRLGRDGQEIFTEGLARFLRRVRVDFFSGLVKFVQALSGICLDRFEQVLYAVDERLRYQKGQSRVMLYVKAAAGMIWGAITYVARIYVNVLIEPQVNPIKHFPVVTVSHKVMLPLTPELFFLIRAPLTPLGPLASNSIAAVTLFLFPGMFGFLVWEFKENWKLYTANRPRKLLPEMIGHHGETMRGFLRPGFHSGTIPRAFGRMRRAERRAQTRNRPADLRRPRNELHHLEEMIEHFLERTMIALLEESRSFGDRHVEVGSVRLTTNRIAVELVEGEVEGVEGLDEPLLLHFDERAGVFSGRIVEAGWSERLPVEARNALTSALAGLFTLGQVEATVAGAGEFGPFVIPWDAWTALWQADADGLGHPDTLVRDCAVPSRVSIS